MNTEILQRRHEIMCNIKPLHLRDLQQWKCGNISGGLQNVPPETPMMLEHPLNPQTPPPQNEAEDRSSAWFDGTWHYGKPPERAGGVKGQSELGKLQIEYNKRLRAMLDNTGILAEIETLTENRD